MSVPNLCFRTLLLLAALPYAAVAATVGAEAELLVDGKRVAASAEGFRIPASHRTVSFRMGRSAQESPEDCHRMRFRLEGVDEEWRQISSEMCVQVRFADARGDQVGQRLFPADGASAGWRGDIESSSFSPRRETVQVPAGAVSAIMVVSSSGPPTAMGVYVVRAVKISKGRGEQAAAVYEMGGDAAHWGRSGTRPSMARTVATPEGEALCVWDDDPNAHAEWSLARAAAPRVAPGEWLTLEWAEMHDIGMGNRFDANYGRLHSGAYTFWSQELDAAGRPLAEAARLPLVVLEPLWKSPWFWLCGGVVAGVLLWLACRAIIRGRLRQHVARVEQERVLEQERLRIARDLHDDLGSRLTHISLVSGLAEHDPESAAARENFQKISGMARDLVAALYQTVWTVNPAYDHLEALVNYLCQLTQNLCESARIRCRIHSCEVPDLRAVTSEVRHNITLAVKEALHNAVKHSGSSEIVLRMEFADPRLSITISDNGRGFDLDDPSHGNGLANMRRRMECLGGGVRLQSKPGEGTAVRFEVMIPAVTPAKFSPSLKP